MLRENHIHREVINLVIIDDHPIFRSGFINYVTNLDAKFRFLYEANNGYDFIQKLPNYTLPNIVLTDIKMPKMDGLKVIEWMNIHYPNIPVIAISFNNNPEFLLKLMLMGIKGNIIKGNEKGDILNTLRVVSSGGTSFEQPEEGALIEYYTESSESKKSYNLSDKKKQFVEKLIEKPTLNAVADEMHISFKTAERWRTSIFNIFNVKSKIELLKQLIKDKLY
jgi:DNA-binding NarL/FixJ family response regulator